MTEFFVISTFWYGNLNSSVVGFFFSPSDGCLRVLSRIILRCTRRSNIIDHFAFPFPLLSLCGSALTALSWQLWYYLIVLSPVIPAVTLLNLFCSCLLICCCRTFSSTYPRVTFLSVKWSRIGSPTWQFEGFLKFKWSHLLWTRI